MIKSKADLREYMESDRIHLGYKYKSLTKEILYGDMRYVCENVNIIVGVSAHYSRF